ncbi:MAG: hypothetical protein AAF702_23385 [Chloroflexota bacterium]
MNTYTNSPISQFVQNISQKVALRRVRAERLKAIESALNLVLNRHVDYVDCGFDLHFFTNRATNLIEPFLNGGPIPSAQALAEEWIQQFYFSSKTGQGAVERARPMIDDFVYVLTTQVGDIEYLTSLPAPSFDYQGISY